MTGRLRGDDACAGMSPVRTTCPYCGVGCGVLASPDGDGCRRCAAIPTIPPIGPAVFEGRGAGETLSLRRPPALARNRRVRVTGTQALDDSWRNGFGKVIAEHGPDAVAFYVSGPTADRGLLRRQQADEGLHRLGQHRHQFAAVHGRPVAATSAPSAATACPAATRTWNWPISWCWSAPTRPGATRCSTSACSPPGRRGRPAIVVIDPRRTATADLADLHLPSGPAPTCCCSTACWPSASAAGHRLRLRRRPHRGLRRRAASGGRPGASRRGRSTAACRKATWPVSIACSHTERTVTVYSQGVNQSASGTDKVNAIINCHLAPAASASPAWGRSRSPASPTPWAGARSAGWPTSWPRTWILPRPGHRPRRPLLERRTSPGSPA
jgi:assimilatory nitrate reductase catalytic subunit